MMMRSSIILAAIIIYCCYTTAAATSLPPTPTPFYSDYGTAGQYELLSSYSPVADPAAIVISNNARFTVLTPTIIRMEYQDDNTIAWEDHATLAFLNRKLPVPQFKVQKNATTLQIETTAIQLTYTVNEKFSPDSLRVDSLIPSSAFKSWHYGQLDSGNLLGTIRTLDGIGVIPLNCTQLTDGGNHHCEFGLISRSGWVIVNDTSNQALDDETWWIGDNADTEDLYMFAHGHDYTQALYEYNLLGGKMAMVPKYATGIWWSRWYNYNNADTRKIVRDYSSRTLPLSVFVRDMQWHTKQGWGGYTFDKRLYPYPPATLQWLYDQGLSVTTNLHDDDGVRTNEIMHDQMALYMGLDPATCGLIKFTVCSNRTYAMALEDVVWKYQLDNGVDFAWIDWQQGETAGGCVGGKMNPTIILSKLRATDHLRRYENVRGMVLARFGGLGNHRYQVGFSGDVAGLTWVNMAFQPYFSLTASNVLYGHWSHDVVGPHNDHELHTRWIQWAAYSGVFRTHDRGMSAGPCNDNEPSPNCAIVRVWDVPTRYYEANRDVMRARSELMPYIYTAYRLAFDTGVSLLRPMYYTHPEADMAYTSADAAGDMAQYMFGDDMLVAPIVKPAAANNMTTKTVWLPNGVWFDTLSGRVRTVTASVGMNYTNDFDLSETPVFVRGGAIIGRWPLVDGATIGRGRRSYEHLEFSVYTGDTSGTTVVYEDDGESVDYLKGAFNLTAATYESNENTLNFSVITSAAMAMGAADTGGDERMYTLKVVNALPAVSVTCNGGVLAYSRSDTAMNTWSYCGQSLTVNVRCVSADIMKPLEINVVGTPLYHAATNGVRGMSAHSLLGKANLDETRVTPGAHTVGPGALDHMASVGDNLSYAAGQYDPQAFIAIIQSYVNMTMAAIDEVSAWKIPNAYRRNYTLALLQSSLQ